MMAWMLAQLDPGDFAEAPEVGFQWTADVLLLIAAVPMTLGVAIFFGILFYRAQKEDERLKRGDKP
ncbi:MAG: hypothetical protein O2819_09060 [Planctomycetota bacterium]|nr:hypothetical protein [Planctomycetota bacterium]